MNDRRTPLRFPDFNRLATGIALRARWRAQSHCVPESPEGPGQIEAPSRLARTGVAHFASALAGALAAACAIYDAPLERASLWAMDRAHEIVRKTDAKYDPAHVGMLGGRPLADPIPKPAIALAWSIPYYIDPSQAPVNMPAEKAIELIRKAADSWAPCGARFEYKGIAKRPEYGANGPGEIPDASIPIISWMNLPDHNAGMAWTTYPEDDSDESRPASSSADRESPGTPPARADFLPGGAGAQPEQWTIELDPDSTSSSSDLLSVATHELGHALGIAHSRDKRSIMFGDANDALAPTERDIAHCKLALSHWTLEIAQSKGMAAPWKADRASDKAARR